jgi:hypothetical protein
MNFVINYWAILLAGVANMVIGFLWYGPILGKTWATEMGWGKMTPEQVNEMKKKANLLYPQAFIGALLTAYVFTHVLQAFGSASISSALFGALMMWLGFIVPLKYGDKLWGGKSFKLFFIDTVYHLIALGVMAIILQSIK